MMMTGGSVYGVHRFYWSSPPEHEGDIAQIMSAEVVQYIRDMGVDPQLFGEMTAADKENHILTIPESELERLNVVHVADSPTWRIENRNGLFVLGGTETMSSINRFGLFCIGNVPALFVSFEARYIRNDHDYQLEIDDTGYRVPAQPRFYPEIAVTLSLIQNAHTVGFTAAPIKWLLAYGLQRRCATFPELMAICRGMVSGRARGVGSQQSDEQFQSRGRNQPWRADRIRRLLLGHGRGRRERRDLIDADRAQH